MAPVIIALISEAVWENSEFSLEDIIVMSAARQCILYFMVPFIFSQGLVASLSFGLRSTPAVGLTSGVRMALFLQIPVLLTALVLVPWYHDTTIRAITCWVDSGSAMPFAESRSDFSISAVTFMVLFVTGFWAGAIFWYRPRAVVRSSETSKSPPLPSEKV